MTALRCGAKSGLSGDCQLGAYGPGVEYAPGVDTLLLMLGGQFRPGPHGHRGADCIGEVLEQLRGYRAFHRQQTGMSIDFGLKLGGYRERPYY